MQISDSISVIKGVGEKTAACFYKLGVESVKDLLEYYPATYDSFEEPVCMTEAFQRSGQIISVRGILVGKVFMKKVRNLTITTCKVRDESGAISLTFFNMPYVRNMIKEGQWYVFKGTLLPNGSGFKMEQPGVFNVLEYEKLVQSLQPRYHLTKGISNKTIAKCCRQVLDTLPVINDYLPDNLKAKYGLCSLKEAIWGIHFPTDEDELKRAATRLVFDEFLFFLCRLKIAQESENRENSCPMIPVADCRRLIEGLPFRLTEDQINVWNMIEADMSSDCIMNRLIQGDVGSGKTIIAILGLLMAVANGYQGAMMAPTEVLARQHYESIREITDRYGLPFRPVLLIGSLTAKNKREAKLGIEAGTYNLVIGTHALVQGDVKFDRLGLVVCDEQHKFGVNQRETLMNKGINPHVMVMSATPIPRTLAVVLYGNVQVCVIKTMPSERKPIKNAVVDVTYRPKAYEFILKQVRMGHQAYVICPLVEAGEMENVENAVDYARKLSGIFPEEVRVGLLHGQIKADKKEQVMSAFADRNIDVLVSTTVIEVGINVPNATVMLIENAERFGLAQLHQLRGRVGRGEALSYCIFINGNNKNKDNERLEILKKSNDGFEIAAEDLKLRGPGDLFGIRQSGEMNFRLADVFRDASILMMAKEASENIDITELGDKEKWERLLL